MARISTYAIDGTPVSSDKLIGTDSAGTVTKNYPLGDVADWLKSSGATAVLGQNNYLFQIALDPDEGRKLGSFSFENYGGDGTEFSAVTELKFSASSSTGQYVSDYLLSTVGQKVLISQLDAPNNFGIYALVSLTQSSLEPTFYDAVLAFVDGNGALQGNESYGLATYSALNEAGGGTWGSITGDIDNQTDLVSYIDNAIAGVPVPPTPTLQSVTDEGNTTTNSISAQSINLNAENGGGIFNSTYSDVNILPKSNAFEFNVRTSSNTGKLRISTDGSLYLASNANSIKLGRLHSGQYPKGQLELGLNGSGYTAFFDADGVNELMRVDGATGNVGIGTTLPTEKLHVQGTAPKIKLHNTSGFETYIEAYTGSGYSGININRDFFINGYNGKTLWSAQGGLSIASQYFYGGYVNFRRRGGTTDLAQIGLENGSNTYFNTGNFGIGTTAPSAKLEVVPAALNQNILSLKNVYGTTGFDFTHVTSPGEGLMMSAGQNTNLFIKTLANGADEGIKFLNSSDTELLTILKDGNVGIGTTAPARKLHIHADTGTAYLQLTQASTGIGSNDGFQISMGASQVNLINRENGNIVFETNNTEKLRITSAGKVGIGTTAPTEKLHVSGNIRLGLLGSQGYYLSWGQNEVSSSGDFARIYGIRTDGAGNQAGHLVFQTKAPLSGNTPSERLRITDVGNVGIGTTTPSSLLTINSQDTLATGITFDNAGSKGYLFGSGTQMNLRAGSTYGITISTSSAALHAFGGIGNFLINLQAPTALPIYAFYQDADTGIGRPSTDTLSLFANGEKMRITSAGRVGIGTTAPTEKLHITGGGAGNIRLDAGGTYYGTNIQAISGAGLKIGNDDFSGYAFFADDGNVGIGTTAPAAKLDVNGSIYPTTHNAGTLGLLQLKEWSYVATRRITGENNRMELLLNGNVVVLKDHNTIGEGIQIKNRNNVVAQFGDATGSGNVGIGTTAPAHVLHINKDNPYIQIQDSSAPTRADMSAGIIMKDSTGAQSFGITQSNSVDVSIRANAGDLSLGTFAGTVIKLDGNNVGIGTTSPAQKLHVSGNIQQTGATDSLYLLNGNEFRGTNNLSLRALNSFASISAASNIFYTAGADHVFRDTNSNNLVTIKQNGNVGIGTTAPSTLLHLRGDSPTLRIEADGANESSIIELVQDGGVTGAAIKYNGASNIEALQFNTGVSDVRMTIKRSNGNVGIGTTSPATKLHIVDATDPTFKIGDASNRNITLRGGTSSRTPNISSYSGLGLGGSDGAFHAFINNVGNVGIGTTAPTEKLHVNGGIKVNGNIQLDGNSRIVKTIDDTDLILGSNDTSRVWVKNDGNVGIGINSPDSKLHVKATSGIAFKVDPNSADKEWYIDTTNPDHLKKEGNLILNADPTNVHASTKISFNIDGSNKASINPDGDLGVGTTAQTSKVHVDGTAMRQLRMGTSGGPSSNTDTSGAIGDMAYDDNYFYIKTINGWGRVALDFGF